MITLSRSLVEPFLTFAARRDLRQKAFEAWTRPWPLGSILFFASWNAFISLGGPLGHHVDLLR